MTYRISGSDFFFNKATSLTKLKWCSDPVHLFSQMCIWNMFMDCVYGIVFLFFCFFLKKKV